MIVVKLDDFDEKKLNKELSYILESITYIPWPKTDAGETDFWHKLKVSLWKKSSSFSNIPLSEGC